MTMSELSTPPGGGKLDGDIAFRPLRVAVLTVSDTRDEDSDTSGKLLAERVTRDGHVLAARGIVKDDVAEIRNKVKSWIADPEIDVVISTGGTGLTGRDVTPEAIQPLFDKTIEGFGTVWPVGRPVHHAEPRLRRGRQRHLDLRPAGLKRGLQGWLGQTDPLAARQSAAALQSVGADPTFHGGLDGRFAHPSGQTRPGAHGGCWRKAGDRA
jgi:hypothetical protein